MSATLGIDHLGLTVGDLEASVAFFTECLGWTIYGGKPDYPAVFVTNGLAKFTLWQQKIEGSGFDRQANVGLHHSCIGVPDAETLGHLFEKISQWPGVTVEFVPEPSGSGPKIHFMIHEPGGTRLEFSYDPR